MFRRNTAHTGHSLDISMTHKTDALVLAQTIYDGFAVGDMPRVLGTMAVDIVWNEAQGNPYGHLDF